MEAAAKREAASDAVPTAKFLQARITALSTSLIKRLENIFAVALDDTGTQTVSGNAPVPPPLTETSAQQFQLDVESTAVIRAAEEIMMLTRTMKEIWLFGGLDTLAHGNGMNGTDDAAQTKMEEDVRIVEEGFKKFLEKYETTLDVDGKKESTPLVEEQSMSS